ncbi:uncharacterized protein LOC117572321 [Drosophila albomicans]|uniref:Uncharacterized protein LOC117572321 n=1 Tax=Drosophila albomicans TaxID=7291 RepID=A0A6P8X424_DROAB|nr:uncharacterized protein LOC117572321 [Drosophila albomicans]
MKIVRRGVTEVNSICNYYQLPIDDIKLHIQLFKQSNGYRPFLFNQTVDYCGYMRNMDSQPLFHAFYKTWITTTNFNHSCPFNHAIVVKNLKYNGNHIMNNLPMPNGEYMVAIKTFTSPRWRSEYKVYVTKTD